MTLLQSPNQDIFLFLKLPNFSFIVNKKANKVQVKKAVEKTYNVNVTSVNTINVLGKSISKFTKTGIVTGRKPSYKKAIVQLKDGEFIDFYSQI